MADFPSLTPAPDYPISPGTWAMSTHVGLNAGETRVRHLDAELGRRLSLSFPAITQAQLLQIVDHYQAQRSSFEPFAFAVATLPAARTPAGYAWLYAGPPQVVDRHADCFDVSVEFTCEPRGLRQIIGRNWRTAQTTLAPGEATDNRWGQKHWISAKGTQRPAGLKAGNLWAGNWQPTPTTLAPGALTVAILGKAWVTDVNDMYLDGYLFEE